MGWGIERQFRQTAVNLIECVIPTSYLDNVDLSLRWAHSHFVGFVTRRLILKTLDLKGTQDRTKRTILVCPF